MEDAEKQEGNGDVCGICQQPFREGDTIVRVTKDRYPTYDSEIVLRTYHGSCVEGAECDAARLLDAVPDLFVACVKALTWFGKAYLGSLAQLEEALDEEAPAEEIADALAKARRPDA